MLSEKGEMEPEQAKTMAKKYKRRLESCPGRKAGLLFDLKHRHWKICGIWVKHNFETVFTNNLCDLEQVILLF